MIRSAVAYWWLQSSVSALLLLLLDLCHIERVSCLTCQSNLEHFGGVCITLVAVYQDAQDIDAVELHAETGEQEPSGLASACMYPCRLGRCNS